MYKVPTCHISEANEKQNMVMLILFCCI